MTIKHPEGFESAKPAGFDGVFDWDFLNPAFLRDGTPDDRQIQPMDIDCIVERAGRFLIFETKEGILPIPQGQIITLESLVMTGRFTVIVIRAKSPELIKRWDTWHRVRSGIKKEVHEGTSEDLVKYCRGWFLWASENPGKWRR